MKRFLSIFLSVLLLFSTMSIAASALDTTVKFAPSDEISLIKYDPTQYINANSSQPSYSSIPYNANITADTPYLFYSYLDANQKAVYDMVKSNPLRVTQTVTLPVHISGKVTKNLLGQYVLSQELADKLQLAVGGGLSAVVEDNPMIFWSDGFGFSPDGEIVKNSDGTYTAEITTVAIELSVNKAYKDIAGATKTYNQLQSAVNAVTIQGETRYEKVKYIHDFICNRVVYDPNLGTTSENLTDHEPTSVFLEPYITVCEGYSEAFKLLCDKAGIPCLVVVGDGVTQGGSGGHAWNYVKMDDNKWYAIDSTWDDSDEKIYYDFFLVGSTTAPVSFNDTTPFSSSHIPTGQMYDKINFALTYPTLATERWHESATLTYDTNGGIANIPSSNLYIGEKTTISSVVPVRTGYTFLGWSTNKNATTAEYKSGGKYVFSENVTLYAVWERIVYTVTYNVLGGQNAPATQKVNFGDSLVVSSTVPKRFGYKFNGWSSSSSAATANYQSGKTYPITANLNLYAVWEMVPILGDVNNDRQIRSDDAQSILRADAGLKNLTADEQSRADANNDGVIDAADAIIILRYNAGLATVLS